MTECDTCERWRSHGGACDGDRLRYRHGEGCLGYREDPRGEKKYRTFAIRIEPDMHIPNVDEETDGMYLCEEGYRYLNIIRIKRISWDKDYVGNILLTADTWYWSKGTDIDQKNDYELKLEKALIEQTKSKDKKIIVFNKRSKDKKKW